MDEEHPQRLTSAATALTVLAVLALLYSLYFARAFLIPIAFAVLLDFLLSPLVRLMTKVRIPTAAAAALVVSALVGALVLGTYQLSGPVQAFLDDTPASVSKAQTQLHRLLRPIERVSENAEKVAAAAGPATTTAKPAQVVVVGPSIASRLAGTTQRMLAALLQILLLLFFLLAGGDLFLDKTIRLIPLLHDKKKAVRIARDIEATVSMYLLTNLGINIVEGVVLGLALWAVGLPNPILWAAMVVLVEFVPYIGALAMTAMLSLAALSAFDDLPHILAVPLIYLVVNFIQGNIVSTMVMGKRLALNSVALFVGLAFWFWIWGIPGAFIGVPLMSVFKICCDHVESLAPIGEFLGARIEPQKPVVITETVAA